MNQVRICYFCEKWGSGGIESFLNNLLMRMDLNRLEVDIVASELCDSPFTIELKNHGVNFYELSGCQRRICHNHNVFVSLLHERQYDVVHLHVFHGLSLYYLWLAKQAGVDVRIVHSHNTSLRKSFSKPVKLLLHKLARTCFTRYGTNFWACSQAAAEFMFPKRVLSRSGFQFIPNGIDVGRFSFDLAIRMRLRRELCVENKWVIGSVGRLCEQKNQDFLLDVFSVIYEQDQNSCLLLVGEGEAEAKLRRKVENLGISKAVIFYGVSKRIEQLLWVMDVFAFPSRFEGLGIAVVEAQAAGLPTICSEKIPPEARLTPLVQVLALKTGSMAWAQALQSSKKRIDRERRFPDLEKFEVNKIVHKIEQCYMHGIKFETAGGKADETRKPGNMPEGG